jgi:hypothetical protein
MNALRITLIFAVAWLMVAGLLALQLWPDLPHTAKQWAVFVGIGPPAYKALEAGFEWLFSRRHGEAISNKPFSIARVFFALLTVVLVFGACGWVARLLGVS